MRTEHVKDALYDVEIKSTGVNIEAKGLSYEAAFGLVEALVKSRPEDHKLREAFGDGRLFGFAGMSHGQFRYHVSAYRKREKVEGETHTCESRMAQLGPWERKENIDTWSRIGDDRVCDFCGSMHPDDLLGLIKAKGFSVIERSTKGYKWYLRRPEIPNAGFGAIKFYLWHMSDDHRKQFEQLISVKVDPTPTVIVSPNLVTTVTLKNP